MTTLGGASAWPRSTAARCHISSPRTWTSWASTVVGHLAQHVVDVVGDAPDGVRQLLGRRRVGIDEVGGQQLVRPDGDAEVAAGVR